MASATVSDADDDHCSIATPATTGIDAGNDATNMPKTPPETIYGSPNHFTIKPRSGATVLIRSCSSGELITLNRGDVFLAPSDSPGCAEWICTERDGKFGFQNRVSGSWLGNHDDDGNVKARVFHFKGMEEFTIWNRNSGYVLKSRVWRLWNARDHPIGVVRKDNMDKLVLDGESAPDPETWEFLEVA
ncbi:MAG: hypothetical protein M1820_010034 [Bogoriella megaspora]|nr:MAG: hypothetical protein M1820_010034 [Bogoriella megaspora]